MLVVTNAFHWRVLETTNYDEFVANLRAVGCPERTIRDILFADAERRYAEAEVTSTESLPFWLAGRALAEANRRSATNRSTAQAAIVTDLKRLFGVDWSPDEGELRDMKVQALSRLVVGPVSDDEHERVWRWFMVSTQLRQSFRQARQNLLLETDHVAWDRIVAERKIQLGQILNPAALEEFQARTALLEEIFDAKLLHVEDLELTPAELRRVCLAKIRHVGWLDDLFEQNRPAADEAAEAKKVAFAAALQPELSAAHYEEFLRVQDDAYRDILSTTRDQELPRRTAQKVYEVRQLAQSEFNRLRAAPDQEEAAAAVVALQLTTQDSIRKIMGAEAFQAYTRRHGQWVTNFTKL